jgi:hypothetical protein
MNLLTQITNQWYTDGQPNDLDWYASSKLAGKTVTLLPTAGLVQRGAVAAGETVAVTAVMNQGFNGQTAAIVTATARRLQAPLSDFASI